jgi:PadR family transcriptional regulator, regulatory protein PadR
MNTENAIQQMRKGVVELCVLSVIASHEEMYPADVKDKLKQAGMEVVEGTLYPMLTRLKNSGHLNYRWQESETGPPRKYYRITDIGQAFLNELQNSWHEFVASVNKVVSPQQSAAELFLAETTVREDSFGEGVKTAKKAKAKTVEKAEESLVENTTEVN